MLEPDFKNQRRVGHLGNPACYYGDYCNTTKHPNINARDACHSQTIVNAICHTPPSAR